MFFYSLSSSFFNFFMNFYNSSLILIFLLLVFEMFFLFLFFNSLKKILSSLNLELGLTFFSLFIILFNFFPSLDVLFMMEEVEKYESIIILNIFGYQWYWNYYISSMKNIFFDSNMINLKDFFLMKNFNLFNRNSDSENRLILPIMENIMFITISDNVIHSWFVLELNLKLETNPGFMNYFISNFNKIGLVFGNCAEICGQGHSSMPIMIEINNYEMFLKYYKI